MYLIKLLIGFLVLFAACKSNTNSINAVEEVDLLGAYVVRYEVPVSSVASDIEYIRLETGKDFMVGNPYLINVKDSLILFIGFRQIYIFSRHTGNFLYEISTWGRGPDEYSATTTIYDEDDDLFFVSYTSNKRDQNNFPIYCAHNFTGEIIKNVSKPLLFNFENDELPISRFWPLNDTLYLGYCDNIIGYLPEKLVIFSSNGKFIKSYPNYNFYEVEKSGSFLISLNNGMFFNASDTVRFFEQHTDTIFSVDNHTIQPRYHIFMGDLLLPYHLRSSISNSDYLNFFRIRTMYESTRFLMFTVDINSFCHIVCYDKIQKRTVVCNSLADLNFYKHVKFMGARCIGFSNDLDQFIPIGTDKNFYINRDDEFVTAIPALEVKRWFDLNPDDVEALPIHLQSFKDIRNEDNPVVIVAKLKK